MTIMHNITLIAGQARRLLLKMTDAAGAPLPEDRYAVTGRVARYGSSCAIEAAPWDEPGTLLLTIPPLVAGAWNYDIFARREDGVSSRLLEGCIEAEARVTPPAAPEHTAAETVTVELSDTVEAITVTVTEITAVAEADWEAIREAADRAEDAAATAAAVLPTLEADVAEAKRTITAAASTSAEQAAAEASVLVAATGAEVQTAVRTTAADATAASLEAIAAAEATAINQAVNNGINAIGQSISTGTGTINAATASGKSEINQTVTNGMALLDGYVGTVSDDIALKSQPNIWGGVNTFNGALVANGGIIAGGQDIIKTIYTAALMDALYCDTAAGWTDKYAGATSGSGYNSLHYGTESSTSYLGRTAAGTLTRTDYTHQMVCKHLAIFGNDCMAGITAVVNLDSNAFWGASNQLTGYCFGQAMQVHADVPFERMIDPEYTPNVGGTPTVMFSAAPNEQVRVDIFYSTVHRQVIVPKIANVTQRSYRQSYVIIWTPTRFMVHLLPAYPVAEWRCIARIDARNMKNLYRTNIIGWQDTNSFRVNISLSAHALNTYAAAGYGDWMQPLIHITA